MRGATGTLLAAVVAGLAWLPAASQAQPARQALLVLTDGVSFEDAVADPLLADLAANGGIGLMTTRTTAEGPDPGGRALLSGTTDGTPARALVDAVRDAGLRAAGPGLDPLGGDANLLLADLRARGDGETIREILKASQAEDLLVVVAAPEPSPAMLDRGEDATAVVVARGAPDDVLEGGGALRGLTSDTTQRQGILSNVDVAPTILDFLEVPTTEEMEGSPARIEGDAPSRLHDRYLEVRRIRFPLEMIVLGLGLGALLAMGLFLAWDVRAPRAARLLEVWALVAVALPVAMLPVSDLPNVTWGPALAVLGLLTALIVAGALWAGKRDATLAVTVVGAVGLSLLVLDAARGWPAMITPVIGGGALDGARFFGLGNAYAGVLLAGAVLVAAHLSSWGGVVLLVGAGLFAGLPGLGSNLGAAACLFAAAGLWYGLRVRRRLGALEIGVTAGAVAVGVVALLTIHGFLAPTETHISRAAEEAVRTGPGEILATFGRRLSANAAVTSEIPAAWLLIAALPAAAVVAWRRLGYLARDPAWRDATLVLALAAMVGFLANDTGIAVAGMAFVFLAAALTYPALDERWMHG